jgi:Flp pilus assembly protein TadG
MPSRFSQWWARELLCCRRGVAAVEFALIAPLFFGMLFAIIAFGTGMSALSSMQSGVNAAARSMAIGLATAGGSAVTCGAGRALTTGTAENYACGALPSWGTYTVTATQNCATLTDTVSITASASTAVVGDVFGVLTGWTLRANAVTFKEGQCP